MPFLLISFGGARLEKINATRTSVAGEGLTEPILYLRLSAQMQTSLATRTKSPRAAYADLGLFCLMSETRTIQSQYAGGILLQPVQKLVATLIFTRLPQGQKCKRVPSGVSGASIVRQ